MPESSRELRALGDARGQLPDGMKHGTKEKHHLLPYPASRVGSVQTAGLVSGCNLWIQSICYGTCAQFVSSGIKKDAAVLHREVCTALLLGRNMVWVAY